MAPKLYSFDLSPAVRPVYMAAKAMGIELEHIETNMLNHEQLKPEFLKLNPQHTIPTLDDGGTIVWDSHAIMVYLFSKYGKNDSLYPKDPKQRAVVDQRLHFDTGVLFALIKSTAKYMRLSGSKTVPELAVEEANDAYGFVDKFLQGRKWAAGDNITLADFSFIPSITSLDCFVPINASKYPNVVAYIKRAQDLPYYNVNQKGLDEWAAFVRKLMS